MPREFIDTSDVLVTEICWYYYVNEMTQAQIATMLSLTRLRVNQAIQRAKTTGMVKIQIESPFAQRQETQQRLQQKLEIQRAVVVPADRNNYDYHLPVGAALASLLSERLRSEKWKSIGVSWGLTLDSTIRRLQKHTLPDLEVVSILGGTEQGSTFNSFGIASGLANVLGARYSILTAPIYLAAGIERSLFLSQFALKEQIDKFEKLDAVLLTCSDISDKSFLVSYGLPKELDPESIISAGVIGDVLGQFLDVNGNSVLPEVDDRTIGMPLAQVQKVPEKIMTAAGPHKVDIIRAACRRSLVDTLVTDDVTAELLLAKDDADQSS